jgi:hypothetical protein
MNNKPIINNNFNFQVSDANGLNLLFFKTKAAAIREARKLEKKTGKIQIITKIKS